MNVTKLHAAVIAALAGTAALTASTNGWLATSEIGVRSFCGSYGIVFKRCGDTTSGDGDDGVGGIARLEKQRLLRPGAGYLLLGAYLCFLVAAGIVAVAAGFPKADLWVARGLCILLALTAVETLINLILEMIAARSWLGGGSKFCSTPSMR